MAPEMILRKKYDTQVDVWSATVTVYIMLSGKPPFKGKDRQVMFDSIVQDKVVLTGKVFSNVSQEAKDFLKKGLNKD